MRAIGNRMVSSAIWIKHARVTFSKSIKMLFEAASYPGASN